MAKKMVIVDPLLQGNFPTDRDSNERASDAEIPAPSANSAGCDQPEMEQTVAAQSAGPRPFSKIKNELEEVGDSWISIPGCRVLLVDHNAIDKQLTKCILELAEVAVSTANNGRTALQTVLKAQDSGRPYDVVLIDMQMPVLDGYETTRVLRQQGYTGPIVALIRDPKACDREHCLAVGCDDHEVKPVRRERLLKTVLKYFGRSKRGVA